MTAQERGWLAGIFEGEGSACLEERGVSVTIAMTDQDVVDRIQALFPSSYGVKCRQRGDNKPIYEWKLRRGEEAARFLKLILPLLGERRSEQARKVLDRVRTGGLGSGHRRKTHCPHGHRYTKANTYRDRRNYRSCKRCKREETRARRAAAKQ